MGRRPRPAPNAAPGAAEGDLERTYRLIAHRPAGVLLGVGVVTLALAAQLYDVRAGEPRLRIETAVNELLPKGDEERRVYDRFLETFGNDEMLFVGVLADDTIFTADRLRRIQRITERIAAVDGVHRVVSLSNTPDVRSVAGEVRAAPLFDDVPSDPAALEALGRSILGNPVHAGTLVARDGRAANLVIHPEPMSETEFRDRGIDRQIEQIAREEAGGMRVVLAGGPPLKAATARLLRRDLVRFLPLGFFFMGLVAFATFRNLRGVAIPLASILLAQIWTMGIAVLMGETLNLVTYIVPALIQTVGFAYSVHVLAEHDAVVRERDGRAGPEATQLALQRVGFAVFMTALTTAAGFLSLGTNALPAVRVFGVLCVIGVLASFVISMSFVPALLSLLPAPRPTASASVARRVDQFANRLAAFDVRHRRPLLLSGVAVVALALLGMTRIHVSTSLTDNLAPDNPLRQGIDAFNEYFDGSATFHIVLESGKRDAFKNPQNVARLRQLQDWLEQQPGVGGTTSLADHVMVINRAFHDGDAAHFEIPDSRRLVSQYLFFFWDGQLEHFVDRDFASANVLVRTAAMDTQGHASLLDRMEAHVATLPLEARVTGNTALVVRTIDEIAVGQAVSLSVATLIIYVILLVFLRSPRIALIALIPNALPVLFYFGVLGLFGISLNVITSLIACVILGIAVDDTIHFMVRFREQAQELGDEGKAAVEALRGVARPVTATTIALALGFGVLAASGLKHQSEFGVLSASMLAFAWLVDVTFTPALCSRLGIAPSQLGRRKRGWQQLRRTAPAGRQA